MGARDHAHPEQCHEQWRNEGPDRGTQYRSAIFYANDEQRDIATRYIAQLTEAKLYPGAIVTRVAVSAPATARPSSES